MKEVYNPYEENIEKFIVFVNDLITELYYEELMCNGETLLQNGACYEFIKIMKNYFEIDNILIEKCFDHCAFEYKGNYYDSTGLIKDKERFSVATDEDILYIEDRFGIHLIRYQISDTVINEISNIEMVPHLPSKFYKNKTKVKNNLFTL